MCICSNFRCNIPITKKVYRKHTQSKNGASKRQTTQKFQHTFTPLIDCTTAPDNIVVKGADSEF